MLRRTLAVLVSTTLVVSAFAATAPAATAATAPVAQIDTTYTKTNATGDIVLAWKPVAGATGYDVEVSGTQAFSQVLYKQRTSAVRWVVPSPLWGGDLERQLFWRVTPVGVGTTADQSQVHSFWRDPAPAPALTSPADGATLQYPAAVSFSWRPVPGASSYTLRYGPVGGATTEVSGITTTTYTPSTSLGRLAYEWSVQAYFPAPDNKSQVTGGTSGTREFSLAWASSSPTLVSPTNGATANDLEFLWNPVPGAAKYVVQIARDDAFTPDTIVLTSEVTGTAFVPTDVLPSTTYYWRVRAYDTNGEEGDSSPSWQVTKVMSEHAASVPPAGATTFKPSFLGGVTTSSVLPTEIPVDRFELSWTPVPRATYYHVTVQRQGGDHALLQCRTASTSATVVAASTSTGNSASALSSSSSCLWTQKVADRIAAGDDVYVATVQAVNMSASSTASYTSSNPDDTTVVPTTKSDRHYFRVGAPSREASSVAGVVADQGPAVTSDVSPTLSWQPFPGAGGYVVTIYADAQASSKVAVLYTTTPRVRSTGVFVPNRTTASTDAYLAMIEPVLDVTPQPTQWQVVANATPGEILWKRSASPAPAGTVAYRGGVPELQMTPITTDQLSGAARGYSVQIFTEAAQTATATLKVDQPYTVAAKSFQTTSGTTKVTSLPTGRYEFAWAVLDPAGNAGAYSERTGFVVGSAAATGLTATPATNGNAVSLTWSNGSSAASYVVTVTGPGAPKAQAPTARGLTLTGLTPGATYSWTVSSKDKDQNTSFASDAATFTTPTAPVTLGSATITGSPASTTVLSWNAVPGASRYLVRVADAAKGVTSVQAVETSALSLVPTGTFAYGTRYVYDVRAVPEVITSTSTRPVLGTTTGSLTVITAPGKPATPKSSVAGQKVTLTWSDLTGAARGSDVAPGFLVRYRAVRTDGLENAWKSVVTGSALTYTVSGLKAGTVYEFQLAAANTVGQGPWSSSVKATTADTKPGAPKITSVTRGDTVATVKWSAPSSTGSKPLTGYVVTKRTYSGGTWSAWSTAGSTTAQTRVLKVTRLKNGVKVEFRVAAKSSAGTGTASAGVVVTPAGKPYAPSGVKAAATGSKKIKVSWTKSNANGSTISGYVVQYSTNGKTWKALKTTKASATSWTWSSAKKGTTYHFRVIAKSNLGSSPASSTARVTAR